MDLKYTRDSESSSEETYIRCVPITPQMIREAVKKLSLRKMYVDSKFISEYLSHCYPVETDIKELKKELSAKLECAVHVGILIKHGEDAYYLPNLRQEAHLLAEAFTAFWEMYNKNKLINPRKKIMSRSGNNESSYDQVYFNKK